MTSPMQIGTGFQTHDMVLVHRVFRREFTALPRMVRGVAEGDTAQGLLVAAHAQEMTELLQIHHAGEDDILWPLLHARAPLDVQLLERMHAQHVAISDRLAPVTEELQLWTQNPNSSRRTALAASLDLIPAPLIEHLDDEEAHVLPLAQRSLTATEWRRLAHHTIDALPKPRRLVFLGHILEDANATERTDFVRHVPVPARVAYRVIGRHNYAKESAAQRRSLSNPTRHREI
jgi:hemerythrin-like domain-containing protein